MIISLATWARGLSSTTQWSDFGIAPYATQVEQDFATLKKAAESGRIVTKSDEQLKSE